MYFSFRHLAVEKNVRSFHYRQLGFILNSSREYFCLWGLGGPGSLGYDDRREVGDVIQLHTHRKKMEI